MLPCGRAVQLYCVYTIQLDWFPAVGLYSVYIVHRTVCTLYNLTGLLACLNPRHIQYTCIWPGPQPIGCGLEKKGHKETLSREFVLSIFLEVFHFSNKSVPHLVNLCQFISPESQSVTVKFLNAAFIFLPILFNLRLASSFLVNCLLFHELHTSKLVRTVSVQLSRRYQHFSLYKRSSGLSYPTTFLPQAICVVGFSVVEPSVMGDVGLSAVAWYGVLVGVGLK